MTAFTNNNFTLNSGNDLETSEISSDTDSEISLSEKIVLESNEKRIRKRMEMLQSSVINLKEQLRLEKELWKEDIEKIRVFRKNHSYCRLHSAKSNEMLCKIESNTSTISDLSCSDSFHYSVKQPDDIYRMQSIKRLFAMQNYRRKLIETENMCNTELYRVKRSLEDLQVLQSMAAEWGKGSIPMKRNSFYEPAKIEEIFVFNNQ